MVQMSLDRLNWPLVALILSAALALFLLLAVAVPQWHVYYPTIRTFGLSSDCIYGTCYGLSNTVACSNTWQDRFRATAAFMWFAILSGFAMIIISILRFTFLPECRHRLAARICLGLAVFALICLIIAVSIFGSTINSRSVFCTQTFCQAMRYMYPGANCYFGACFALAIISMLLAVGLIALFLLASLLPPEVDKDGCPMTAEDIAAYHKKQSLYVLIAIIILVFFIGFTMGAALGRSWVVVGYPTQSLGVWQNCAGGGCAAIHYPAHIALVPSTGCVRSGNTFRDRMNAAGVFAIFATICNILLTVYFALIVMGRICEPILLKHYLALIGFTFLSLLFTIISMSIYGGTVNHWLTCGHGSYCDALTWRGGQECTYGFSSAMIFISFFFYVALLVLLIWRTWRLYNHGADFVVTHQVCPPACGPVGPGGVYYGGPTPVQPGGLCPPAFTPHVAVSPFAGSVVPSPCNGVPGGQYYNAPGTPKNPIITPILSRSPFEPPGVVVPPPPPPNSKLLSTTTHIGGAPPPPRVPSVPTRDTDPYGLPREMLDAPPDAQMRAKVTGDTVVFKSNDGRTTVTRTLMPNGTAGAASASPTGALAAASSAPPLPPHPAAPKVPMPPLPTGLPPSPASSFSPSPMRPNAAAAAGSYGGSGYAAASAGLALARAPPVPVPPVPGGGTAASVLGGSNGGGGGAGAAVDPTMMGLIPMRLPAGTTVATPPRPGRTAQSPTEVAIGAAAQQFDGTFRLPRPAPRVFEPVAHSSDPMR